MSYPYFSDVQRAYDELRNEGKIGPRTNQEQVEADKGLLTCRAAYYANQRDASHGLLAKASGNSYAGMSVDWILRNTDGEGWDVATDDGTQALPSNGGPYGPDAARIPDWRQPTADLAQVDDSGGGTTPVPPPPDYDQQLIAIRESIDALSGMIGGLAEQIYHMRTQTWHGDCALGARMNFGVICPPMPEST